MKGKLTYTGIRVKDMDDSIGFYTKVLGMKLMGRNKIEATNGEVASLLSEEGGPTLDLNHYEKDSKHYSEYTSGEQLDHLAFQVENLEEALEEAKIAGYPTVLDMKSETSRWAYIQDPNGVYIELFG